MSQTSIRDSVIFSKVSQAVLLYVGLMLIIVSFDTSFVCCVVIAGLLNLGVMTFFARIGREGMPNQRDLLIIRWAFLPLFVLTGVAWLAVFWH